MLILGRVSWGERLAARDSSVEGSEAVPVPQRIISLGPSLTEALYTLGVSDNIVGVTTYCKKPIQAQEKTKVGTAMDVDVEKVLSLKPDLVLATSLSDANSIAKLKNLGVRVEEFPAAKNFEQLCEEFLRLSDLVVRHPEAEALLSKVRADIDVIRAGAGRLSKPRVVVQVGANPLWVAPRDSFINDLVEFAAGINVIPSGTGHFSREKILELNPDVIIITTMGIVGEEERTKWRQYQSLAAVKNNRIYVVDENKFCSPTPGGFVATLKETVKLLHPEYE